MKAELRTGTHFEVTDGTVRHICCGELEGSCTCGPKAPPDPYDLAGLARARGEPRRVSIVDGIPDPWDLEGLEAKRRAAMRGRGT